MQLTFSDRENKTGRRPVPEAAAAVFLGAAVFRFALTAFGLSWSLMTAFSGNPARGFLSVANSIADRLGASDYIILPRYAAGMEASGGIAEQGLFLSLALLLLCVLSWLIIRSGFRPLLLIPLIPALALLLGTQVTTDPWSLALLLSACAGCYAVMADKNGAGSWWLLVLPAAALLASLCIGVALDQVTDLQQNPVQKKSVPLIEELAHSRYGSNPLGNGALEKLDGERLVKERGLGEYTAASLKEGTGDDTKTALTVTSDGMDAWYLRGFVGEQYDGRKWSPLSNGEYYSQRGDLYWLNRQGFDGLSQMMGAAEVSGQKAERRSLTVETEKADASLAYLPYELADTWQEIPDGTRNHGGAFLASDRFLGTDRLTVSSGGNMTGSWTDMVGRLYEAENTDALQDWFISESHYNVWCYEKDLQIPDETYAVLYDALGDPGDLSQNHAPYGKTIEAVTEYLDRNFLYSEDFGPLKEGKDFVAEFVEKGKGCDAHYAALATLMFRYYGIPARYVEGYLVTPSDAKAGDSVSIGYSHDHAWTEIYIDGFGWVPLEVTPLYQGIMPRADLTRGLDSVKYENREQEQEQAVEEELPVTQEDRGAGVIRGVLLALLILLLLALLAWFSRNPVKRQLAWRRWKKAFAGGDSRRAVCAMYEYMYEENVPISDSAARIGDLAAYSRIEISEQDRKVMRYELENGQREKKRLKKESRVSVSDRVASAFRRMRRK